MNFVYYNEYDTRLSSFHIIIVNLFHKNDM